jgi:CheY-like chemotaxis protein
MGASAVGHRVLIVEDYPDAAEVLCELLEMLGHRAEHVHSGERAVAAAEDFDPDVVLVDLGLPDIDGYEVARRLRVWGRRRSLTIGALTGWSRAEDVARIKESGFDLHLIKPASLDMLVKVLERAPAAAPRPSPGDGTPEPR